MKRYLRSVVFFLLRLLLILFQWSLLLIILYRVLPVPLTPLHVIRVVEQLSDGEPVKLTKEWVSLEQMSSSMPLAVMASEDPLFMTHYGFDFEQIKKAIDDNQRKGKKLRGASTISQQTAKNLLLWPKRSWLRKGIEAYVTLGIETYWTKERILEVYLNIIETGPGMYGVETAAGVYFKKPASRLQASECALIAAVLPNPRRWSPAKPTSYILRKQKIILQYMNYLKHTSK